MHPVRAETTEVEPSRRRGTVALDDAPRAATKSDLQGLLVKLLRLVVFAWVVASVALGLPAPSARGDSSEVLGRLSAIHAEVLSARGPLAYVALRKVWAEWDAADPAAVEEVLREVAIDDREPPAVRAYAALLQAYARRRRGDLEGARARIARLGYIDRWILLGPFDNDGKAGFTTRYEPEAGQSQPLNLTRDYEGKDHRPRRWRMLPPVSPFAWVDFGAFLSAADHACVYATTFVHDARLNAHSSRPVSIWTGAAGAERLWWNGVDVLADDKYRDLDSDRFAVAVVSRPGWNRLTAKVCGDERAPMLSLRLGGPDGAPDDHLEVDPDPGHASREDAAVANGNETPVSGGVQGPVQSFERLVQTGDPAVLEGYARYLETTGADDPTEHRARELARKAAEKSPTIERLLLAGEVAESRNQRASWIDRAEALAVAGHASRQESIEVLLARANYLRAGVNARDSVPYYERVLALDSDNLPAMLAKVDLYEDAGLHDTALSLIQSALARRPRSVGLLRASVAALRQEGRELEADEAADRYAAVRFDDPTLLRARIDVAVSRRDAPAAAHWIERLLAMNPGSTAGFATAARAWMRLGDRARAIAAYRSALEISPDDTDVMRQLAAVYGVQGERDEQLGLLTRVLELMPQAKDVRDQVAHIGPPTTRPDERFARPPAEFLANRDRDAAGRGRRSLVDLSVTTVFPNGLASRFHQVVYQPLTEAAAAESREYEFTYEADSQTAQIRAARVYRKDGRVDTAVESGPGGMADDPELAIYTSARSFHVGFPRLEPGDVVELQYRVEDIAPRNAFADYFGEVVYLQGAEPIARAEYVLITPASRTFYFNDPAVPGIRRSVESSGDQRIDRFVALDVPAVEQEPSQPAWAEVLGHVNVSTYKTWDEMGRWYWGLVKDQFIPDDEVRLRAEALTRGLKDDAARVRAIYDYVVQKTRYVALEFGIHGYKPYRSAQIFARGFGDCKDKATLIVTMLDVLGIKAVPVVVRTANKGDIETAPASLAPFDHMIAYVPSLNVYLDGTAEYTGSVELPAMDRGAIALRVDDGHAHLVRLPDPPASASVTSYKVAVTLEVGGSADLDWRADVTGVEASQWRVRFHAESTRKARIQQMLGAILPATEVTAIDAGNFEDVETPIRMRVHGRAPQFSRPEGDAVTIPVGRREHMVRDFASLTTRKLDLRMHAQWTAEDDWTVKLPSGAKIRSAPAVAKGSSPFGSYDLDVETAPGLLRVKTAVTLTSTRVAARDYAAFRAWCEEVDRALGQRATVELR